VPVKIIIISLKEASPAPTLKEIEDGGKGEKKKRLTLKNAMDLAWFFALA